MSLPHNNDRRKSNCRVTRCALLTGAGRSAIAVIGLQGPESTKIVADHFTAASKDPLRPGQVRYGTWANRDQAETASESIVVTPCRTDSFEIHCHGGPAAIERILHDLQRAGASRVERQDWMTCDLLIEEATLVLSHCRTARTAAIALDQVRGALSDWARARLAETAASAQQIGCMTTELLAYAPLTTRLAEPLRVVLTGPPNVGKSSLLNALVGYDRSITHGEAGTTRDVVHVDTAVDGLPIRLSDTAGIRQSTETIELAGISRARTAVAMADLILNVHAPDANEDDHVTPLDPTKPAIRVLNKCDLLSDGDTPPQDAILTSALQGEGIAELLGTIAKVFEKYVPDAGQPVPINDRQLNVLQRLASVSDLATAKDLLRELLGSDHR